MYVCMQVIYVFIVQYTELMFVYICVNMQTRKGGLLFIVSSKYLFYELN